MVSSGHSKTGPYNPVAGSRQADYRCTVRRIQPARPTAFETRHFVRIGSQPGPDRPRIGTPRARQRLPAGLRRAPGGFPSRRGSSGAAAGRRGTAERSLRGCGEVEVVRPETGSADLSSWRAASRKLAVRPAPAAAAHKKWSRSHKRKLLRIQKISSLHSPLPLVPWPLWYSVCIIPCAYVHEKLFWIVKFANR